MKTPLAVLAIIAALLGYLAVSSPSRVVVKGDGTVEGLQNMVREALQRERFWSLQYHSAVAERNNLLGQPERDQKLRQELAKIGYESQARMDQLYRENPALRPSQAAKQAEALRELADRIEQAELDQMLDMYRRKRLAELEQIIAVCLMRKK